MRVRRFARIIFLACLVGPLSSATVLHRCGGPRMPVKVLADPDVSRVDMLPRPSSVHELRQLQPPVPLPANTRAPAELRTYRLVADLLAWASEEDGDVHLVIATPGDTAETMIAEIPDEACALASPYRSAYPRVRAVLFGQLGPSPSTSRRLPVPRRATLTGVGFFDFPHHQIGVAPNAIELHPLLDIEFSPHPK